MSNGKKGEPRQRNPGEQISLESSHGSVKVSGCSQKRVNTMELSYLVKFHFNARNNGCIAQKWDLHARLVVGFHSLPPVSHLFLW